MPDREGVCVRVCEYPRNSTIGFTCVHCPSEIKLRLGGEERCESRTIYKQNVDVRRDGYTRLCSSLVTMLVR